MSKVTFTSPTIAGVLDGWHWITLRDVVLFTQYGLSVRGRLTGKYPMLRMNNIINGKISTDTLQYVDLDDQTFARHRLVDGE